MIPISGQTAVYALLGRPVRHSRSPAIHNALLRHHRLDGIYVCLEIPEPTPPLGPILRCLAGANLTVPFKTQVISDLDEISPLAKALGAVNTVIHRDEKLIGENTDAQGFLDGLDEAFGPVHPQRGVVLGAGGAGRAVAAALAQRRTPQIWIANRGRARAEATVRQLQPYYPETHFRIAPLSPSLLTMAPDLVVNATSGPAAETLRRLDLSPLPEDGIWCDLNYWMDDPPCVEACRARGLRVQGGLAMLVHQAALAFERWTQGPADRAVAWSAARADPPPIL